MNKNNPNVPFVAACGGPVKKYLWWKKYLTIIQVVMYFIIYYLKVHRFAVKAKLCWLNNASGVYLVNFSMPP